MTHIYYHPDEKEVQPAAQETILKASLRSGIPHTHVCGGNARCSTCRVMIVDGLEYCGPRNEKEQLIANRLHFQPNIRLACQTQIQGPVKLRRLVLDDEDIELVNRMRVSSESSVVGMEKQIAILFSDIRGFTSFSESLPPYDVIHTLNRYFHQVGEAISAYGGVINNYMGDGIMALFGLDDDPEAPLNAVKAGLGMLEVVEQSTKPYMEAIYGNFFEIGIGIHYGNVVVGTIGARDHKTETAIGDAVNFASRIESANKAAGTNLLISDNTYTRIKDAIIVGRTTRVMVKGKTGEHMLYEVVGLQ